MTWCPAPAEFETPAPWLAPYASQGLRIARQAWHNDNDNDNNCNHNSKSESAKPATAGVTRQPTPPSAALLLDLACKTIATPHEDATRRGAPAAASIGKRRFVTAGEAPASEAYEVYIQRTARIPTRDNLHDFFNGLVWLKFPHAKQRLNALQAGAIATSGITGRRGPLRDALTLFDENGAVLDAPPSLWSALLARDWQRLFVTERAAWREARLLVFGHALLEKLRTPRKPLTAHVLMARTAARSIAIDDDAIAQALAPAHLITKPFVPLPVLGVPGWWPPNEAPGFYADASVFRAASADGDPAAGPSTKTSA